MSSPTDPSSGTIVKFDRTGRIRYSAQYKQEVLASFASSSLSAPVFARQCGIKYPESDHLALMDGSRDDLPVVPVEDAAP